MGRSLKLGLPICGFLVLSACGSRTQAKPDPFGYRQLTTDGGKSASPSLSRDGKFVVYSSDRASLGKQDIWVQDVDRGTSVRVTDDPATDYDPVFSSDGRTIYFSSLREPQGIYRVAASGGEAELVARGATSPRVSPGGEELLFSDASGHLALLRLADHSMRELPENFFNSYSPKWSPDGKEILFSGKAAQGDEIEWWVTSPAGGTPVNTGLVSALRQGGFSDVFAQAWLPGDEIVFAGKRGDQITLWRFQLTPDRRGMADQPVRATNDDSGDFGAAYAAGRLVFERSKGSPNLWSLPVDVNQARVTGELTRLTSTDAQKGSASVSADGQKLLYSEEQDGTFRLVFSDLAKGRQSIVGPAENSFYGVLSADGSRYWFGEGPPGAIDVFARSIKGWRSWWSHSVCALCGMPRSLSRDGKSLLTWSDTENHVDLVDLGTGKARRVLENSGDHFYGPELSPNGDWISFVAGTGKDISARTSHRCERKEAPSNSNGYPQARFRTVFRWRSGLRTKASCTCSTSTARET